MRKTSLRHPTLVILDRWVECSKCRSAVKDEEIWEISLGGEMEKREDRLRAHGYDVGPWIHYVRMPIRKCYVCIECAKK